MTTEEIRTKYLEFFAARGHVIIPRAKLVPEGDTTTLFTGSGMQPMVPYLLGETHPEGKRLVNSQTCLRAQDIDDVGDNRHTTFFEMLGNWSLGDYFKKDQIEWMFEFLSGEVGLDMSKIYITCYIGDERYDIPRDDEAATIWQKLFQDNGLSSDAVAIGSEKDGYDRGVKPGERIFFYDGDKNWWSRNGGPETTPIGDPCGPDSEIFYDFGTPHDTDFGEHCHPNCDCGRFMEIGNNVFMAYKKVAEGKFEKLEKPNIDHGSGLERIAAAAINDPDVFKISLIWPIIQKLEKLSGEKYESNTNAMRVIADHLRAATFLAVDGVKPSNKEQGYVMRRLVRRAVLKALSDLQMDQNFLSGIVPVIADLYRNDFPEIEQNRDEIIEILIKEEKAFRQTIRKGLKELSKKFPPNPAGLTPVGTPVVPAALPIATGEDIFTLQDTYGFPKELSVEIIELQSRANLSEDWRVEFDTKMAEQRQRSQTATKGTFKGGLGGQTMEHKRYHTATHLLQSALRQLFGEQLRQHGSNITEERLRFDFNLDRKMTPDEIAKVEELVNRWIVEDLPVKFTIYPTDEALKMGAIGPFGERYGDEVKVYQMGPDDHIVSLEICGGPHVDHTGQLAETDDNPRANRKFKITKEESIAAGMRRVKAILA